MTNNKRILIVDDDLAIVDALSIVIEEAGYKVSSTGDTDRVLEEISSFSPHLILLDLLLSGKDGTQVIKEIKEIEKYKKIPIIMLSAHPTASVTAKSAGATDFLAKPFEIDELLDKVSRLL